MKYISIFKVQVGGSEYREFLLIESGESPDALCEEIVVADNESAANIIGGAEGEVSYIASRPLLDGDYEALIRLGLAYSYFDEASIRDMIEVGLI